MGTQEMIYAAVASVIGGLVLLTMFHVQRKGQDASIDAVQYRTAKSSMLSMVEIMERDFQNFGSYMYWDGTTFVGDRLHPNIINDNTSYDSSAVTGGMRYDLQFITQSDSLEPYQSIQYIWEPIVGETVTLKDGTVRQRYQLSRLVGGVLTHTDPMLTELRITIMSDTALMPIIVNPVDIRLFKVRARGVSPIGKAETVEETRFDATYRPIAMSMYD